MEKFTLCEGVMARMMEIEAWKNISGNYPFSEVQLEKFADKVDWEEISGNTAIAWTDSILEKFADRLNWKNVIKNWSLCVLDVNAVLGKFGDMISATEFKASAL